MRSLIAYFLGILTVLIILIPFWYVAKSNTKIKQVYKDVFCNSIETSSSGSNSNLISPTTTSTGKTIGGNNNGSVYTNGGNASSTSGSGING